MDFKLTDDERRNIIAQRIKNMEAARYNAEITLDLLDRTNDKSPGAEQARATCRDEMRQADEGIANLIKMYEEFEGEATNGDAPNPPVPLPNRSQRRARASKTAGKAKANG